MPQARGIDHPSAGPPRPTLRACARSVRASWRPLQQTPQEGHDGRPPNRTRSRGSPRACPWVAALVPLRPLSKKGWRWSPSVLIPWLVVVIRALELSSPILRRTHDTEPLLIVLGLGTAIRLTEPLRHAFWGQHVLLVLITTMIRPWDMHGQTGHLSWHGRSAAPAYRGRRAE